MPLHSQKEQKLDPKIVSEIVMFVDNHEHVGFSPNMNNMLKVIGSDEQGTKKSWKFL